MRDQGNQQRIGRYLAALCLVAVLAGSLSLLGQPNSAAQANPTATPTAFPAQPTRTGTASARPPAAATPAETATAATTSTATATTTVTETPQATETARPTETTAPTETAAPTSTASPTPTATITVVLAELVPTATPNLTSEQEQIGTITVLVFLGIVVVIIGFAIRWMIRAAKDELGGE